MLTRTCDKEIMPAVRLAAEEKRPIASRPFPIWLIAVICPSVHPLYLFFSNINFPLVLLSLLLSYSQTASTANSVKLMHYPILPKYFWGNVIFCWWKTFAERSVSTRHQSRLNSSELGYSTNLVPTSRFSFST